MCCGVLWCVVVCCGVLWCVVVCCGVACVWFRRVEGRAVSIQGLAPTMQQITGRSPRESDSRATAPAPTCPDCKSQKKTYGNMERDK